MLDRTTPSGLHLAHERATGFLLAAQGQDGAWRDFHLPVGMSDGWITALCAAHLRRFGGAKARAATTAAADYLERTSRAGTWGYNAGIPPDADSTAWAALALEGTAVAVDLPFLRAHQRRDGAVATYLANDGWGGAHGCVTALAARAFDRLGNCGAAARARGWLHDAGPSARAGYWWASPFYPAWAVASAFAGRANAPPLPPLDTARSILDLACALRIAALSGQAAPDLTARLCGLQMADGGFPPSACLRVTYHWLATPEQAPAGDAGRIYADSAHILGTCFSLAAIAAQTPLIEARQ